MWIKKVVSLLALFVLAAQPTKAMDPEPGMYWNDLSEGQRSFVRSYNRFRIDVNSLLCTMHDDAFSASFCEEMFRQSDSSVLKLVDDSINSLQRELDQSNFSALRTQRIAAILAKNKVDLVAMFSSVQEAYDALRTKKTAIMQTETDVIREDILAVTQKFATYFPSNIENIKKIFFPDFMGDRRPINAKILQTLAEIEADIDARKELTHNETVMAYGSVLAQKYFQSIVSTLPELIELGPQGGVPNNIEQWLNSVGIEQELRYGISQAVHQAQPFNSALAINGLRVGAVWELTYHLVRTIYEQKNDDEAKNLLLIYAMKLNEQGLRCNAGGIGRNFEVLVKAYKLLIERNSK